MHSHQVRNTLLLVLGALIWGVAFVAQAVGSGYVGAYTFLACRSWLACIFLAGLWLVRRQLGKRYRARPAGSPPPRFAAIRGGVLCGVFLFAASAAQQMGVGTVSTAKASFLTALYIVLVPLAGVFTRNRPGWRIWLCIAASVAGLYLLCMAGRDTLSLSGGEWQLLLAALLFAVQILLVGRYSPRADGVALSFWQFLTVSVLSTVCMFLFEQPTLAAGGRRGGGHPLLRHPVQRRGLHAADHRPAGPGPHHRQPCHVSGERFRRPVRLAAAGPEPDRRGADRLRADVRRHCGLHPGHLPQKARQTAEGRRLTGAGPAFRSLYIGPQRRTATPYPGAAVRRFLLPGTRPAPINPPGTA